MTSSVSFVAGKRGSQNAVVDGCRYTKNSSHKERVYYRCVEQATCKARIILTGGALSTPLHQHTHPSQSEEQEQGDRCSKMSRLSRRKANRTLPSPTSLENICIPPWYMTSNQNESLLLWDSGYTAELYFLILIIGCLMVLSAHLHSSFPSS